MFNHCTARKIQNFFREIEWVMFSRTPDGLRHSRWIITVVWTAAATLCIFALSAFDCELLAVDFPVTWKITQSCLTVCDPMDCIVHGVLHATILEWVAVPFSSRSSQPRNQTAVSRIAGRFFTNWAMKEAHASGIEAFYNLRKYILFHIYCILRPPRTKWKACLLFYVICMKVILFKVLEV